MKHFKLKQRGDTIIEVMLAMAVIGLTLGIAYNLSNSAFNTGRNAQEREEALKLAEAQIERLKIGVAASTPATISTYENTSTYCILPNGTVNPVPDVTNPANPCNGLNGGLYSIRIEYSRDTSLTPVFKLYKSIVIWDTLGTGNQSIVELRYRP